MKVEGFNIGDKVKIFQLTTTYVGDCAYEVFVGNIGTYSGSVKGSYFNDAIVEFKSRHCLVSACDLEIEDE